MNAKQFTPDNIQQDIDKDEIPLRSRTFAPDIVNEIFRYGAVVGSVIEQYERISRGADALRQRIREAEEKNESFHSGTVILADEMEHSKGRFKRYWHAPKGGLWMTLGLANTLLPQSSLLLPMAAGVSCCEVLRSYGIEAHIKWVNDTLVQNRKVSGILTESFTGPRYGEEYILIGIGINVNNNRFPAELSETATSMKSCLNMEVNLQELTVRLLAKLQWNIGLLFYEEARHLEEHGGMAVNSTTAAENLPGTEHLLLKSYKKLTDIFNRRVVFGFDVQNNPQFEAKVIGLDSSGGLILEMADSSRTVQHSGEIIYLD
ncbi:MAG: biotin--[acetyl-CoA-carboxylase] ligase [Deltaproteobacteria bacterium]|nr:biotin--[acetyl-CoA-carboxylase] ligase [Deltaproteobacteria bacterium]